MERAGVYNLFDEMIELAVGELERTIKEGVAVETKLDGTMATTADNHIGEVLLPYAREKGYDAVSEEQPDEEIIKTGNYLIVDEIDGTLKFNHHLETAGNAGANVLEQDLGHEFDYSLLIGIVENGKPRFGCVYNYVTREKIFMVSDGEVRREGKRREGFDARVARYVDVRAQDPINSKIDSMEGIARYEMGSVLGIGAVLMQTEDHDSYVLSHFPQGNGLWDILPAAVIAEFTGTKILHGNGKPVVYDDYIRIPKGVVFYKGEEFSFVEEMLPFSN